MSELDDLEKYETAPEIRKPYYRTARSRHVAIENGLAWQRKHSRSSIKKVFRGSKGAAPKRNAPITLAKTAT